MCDCLEKSIKQIKEKYPKWKEKEVDDIFYSDCGINFTTGKMNYGMGIDIRFKGQKKLGHTMLNISHCPLCGIEFEKL
jgi:hypothetical protein